MSATDYQTLLLKIQELTEILDVYVNGSETDVVAISNGRTLGTLSALNKRARSIRYVQKIVDYKTKTKADSDAAANLLIAPGSIVRVFGETNSALNRLYEVQEDKTLAPIDYADLYDIVNEPLYPFNHKVVRQTVAQLKDPRSKTILTYNISPSTVTAFNQFLSGTVKVVSQKTGTDGALYGKFSMLVWLRGDVPQFTFSWVSADHLLPSGSNLVDELPELEVSIDTSNGDNYVLRVDAKWNTTLETTDPVMVEWFIDGFQRSPFY